MRQIKQSTARNILVVMIDSTDHIAGKTGLTLTITASKAGGAFSSITPTVTERTVGGYQLALTSSHTDTLGDLVLHITGTGADPQDVFIDVVGIDVQDSVRAGLTALPNAAAEAAGGLYTRGTGAGQINQAANGMIDANVVRNAGTAIVAASGRQEVNVSHFGGTAGTFLSGRPAVSVEFWGGVALSEGVDLNLGKVRQGIPTSSGTTTTIHLGNGASSVDDAYNGMLIRLVSGTGGGQTPRVITDYVGSTFIATVSPAWAIAPESDTEYVIYEGGANLLAVDSLPNVDATLNLKKLNVVNSAGDAIVASSTGSNGHGVNATGNGSGEGIRATGGATGNGISAVGSGAGSGIDTSGGATGHGIWAQGGSTSGHGFKSSASGEGSGIYCEGDGAGDGIFAQGGIGSGTGVGIRANSQGSNRPGFLAEGIGTGAGIKATAGGSGVDLEVSTTTAALRESFADSLLGRAIQGGTNTGRLVKQAFYALRNKVTNSGGTMTVYETDDSTTSWTAATTTGGSPITSIDPS